ncbi:MAG TPA: hypothetical protein VMP10_00985 [Chloroflexota bacterium]|nr:hypothetical protein [Chloroflexota bacterium]
MRPRLDRLDNGTVVRQSAIGGIITGLSFALFQMVAAAANGESAFAPLRLIAAIAAGPEALAPDYPLASAVGIGLSVHLVLSMLFGLLFGVGMVVVPAFEFNATSVILVAALYGFLLWIVNFNLIAPGTFPWFDATDAALQIIAHTIFYGAALGFYLSLVLPVRHEVV